MGHDEKHSDVHIKKWDFNKKKDLWRKVSLNSPKALIRKSYSLFSWLLYLGLGLNVYVAFLKSSIRSN